MSHRHQVKDSVVVITGASSGIGRAAAVAFAKDGAVLVLAARRENALREAGEECSQLSHQPVLTVGTDVSDEEQVEALARQAVDRFGRIDTWVNNAAVTMFAPFVDTTPESFRRVMEVDFFGYVHGARAALPRFIAQRRGVLINAGSMVSRLSQPYMAPYVAAKHGVRGLGMALRQELALAEAGDIHVCTVIPASIDTPLFQHAANYTGRAVKVMPPVYAPERVAGTIVKLAARPRREVFVGNSARLLSAQQILAPGLTERLLATLTDVQQLERNVPAEHSEGNLFHPMEEGRAARGGWQTLSGRRKGVSAAAGVVTAAGVGIVTAAVCLRAQGRRQDG